MMGVGGMNKEFVSLAKIVVERGLQTGPFGSQLKASEYKDLGIPVVMPKDIDKGKITTRIIAYISKDKATKALYS